MNGRHTIDRYAGMVRGIALAAALVTGLVTVSAATSSRPSRSTVEGGKSSVEELVSDFLAALAAEDRDALQRLRFSEAEYREIIHPGSVEVGKPFRKVTQRGSDLAWGLLNDKSTYYEQFLIASFGGRPLSLVDMQFERGERDYAGFRAHGQLRLSLRSDDGEELYVRTGSIGEMNGQYKFISFIRD